MEAADFSGYATKAGLKCSDGRTIMPEAFKQMDGATVPLVWQHGHNDPGNVIGRAVLEHRDDGVYCYGYFNETNNGQAIKKAVQHRDITQLSIYANQLVEKAKQVFHGAIREVSLVLAGANPGALIDNVAIQHSDADLEILDDEAVIFSGEPLELTHSDESDESTEDVADEDAVEHADEDERTLADVYDEFSEEQKAAVHYMIGIALEAKEAGSEEDSDEAKQSAIDDDADDTSGAPKEAALTHTEGSEGMTSTNVFESSAADGTGATLTHAQIEEIRGDLRSNFQRSRSFKAAVQDTALQHGIENLEVLFPDNKMVGEIELDKRRTAWVSRVMGGVRKAPFARVKSVYADLSYEDARAKGYVTGALKKEEYFSVAKRVTNPQTVYKKQKLDRDDIIDITDVNVVNFMKAEMRLMLEEEIARAILVGDGRSGGDADKIQETNIRPIVSDHPFYAHPVEVNLGATPDYEEVVDAMVRARRHYKGTGEPVFFTSDTKLSELLLIKDNDGHRKYKTRDELATAMGVSAVVPVEILEDSPEIVGVAVNLSDYVVGTDRGGETTMFDDFDIDYNQYKYLIETRLSGALTKPHSALVVKSADSADAEATVVAPAWDGATYTVTIPSDAVATGVVYQDADGNVYDNAGTTEDVVLTAGQTLQVWAVADDGYYIKPGTTTSWSYLRPSGS